MQTTVMFFDSKQQSVRVYNEDGIFFVALSIKGEDAVVGRANKKFYTVQEAMEYADVLLHDTPVKQPYIDNAIFADHCPQCEAEGFTDPNCGDE